MSDALQAAVETRARRKPPRTEEAPKAVLTDAGVRVGEAHDLERLFELLADSAVDREGHCALPERTSTGATQHVGEA